MRLSNIGHVVGGIIICEVIFIDHISFNSWWRDACGVYKNFAFDTRRSKYSYADRNIRRDETQRSPRRWSRKLVQLQSQINYDIHHKRQYLLNLYAADFSDWLSQHRKIVVFVTLENEPTVASIVTASDARLSATDLASDVKGL